MLKFNFKIGYDICMFNFNADHNFDDMPEKHEPSEDEIAQLLLENAEVLEENGKNVIGYGSILYIFLFFLK